MKALPEEIREAMLTEHELTGRIYGADWLEEFPAYAEQIEAFARELTGGFERTTVAVPPPTGRDPEIARWIAEYADDRRAELAAELAVALPSVGPAPVRPGDLTATRAAVLLHFAQVARRVRKEVTKKFAMKLTIALELRSSLGLDLKPQPYLHGPYDRALERAVEWAGRSGMARVLTGHRIEVTPGAGDLLAQAEAHLGAVDAYDPVVEFLATLSDSELDRWTTVLFAAREVVRDGGSPTVEEVAAWMDSSGIWGGELKLKQYTRSEISGPLRAMTALGLLPTA